MGPLREASGSIEKGVSPSGISSCAFNIPPGGSLATRNTNGTFLLRPVLVPRVWGRPLDPLGVTVVVSGTLLRTPGDRDAPVLGRQVRPDWSPGRAGVI